MTSAKINKAKLLFILSNDYGELSNALYLVMGEPFDTTLLMPGRLYALNKDSLVVPTRRYSVLADVIAAVEDESPDIIFIFSGYLYTINNIFDLPTLAKLVDSLRSRHCRVVTSDPFLGLMARLDNNTFSDRHPAKAALTNHFSRVFAVLRDVPHLYLVDIGTSANVSHVSFFNPHIVLDQAEKSARGEGLTQELGITEPEHVWLYVLASEDYGYQMGVHGGTRFENLLIARLRDAELARRQPVLIAPQPCIDSLRSHDALPQDALLLPFCRYDHFTSLLLAAEHAFYWNIFSNSLLLRVVNYRSVFFFAQGHMVHAIKPLFEVGMKYYYADSELPLLSPEQALVPEELASLARGQEQSLEAARSHFRRSPTPQEMVEQLLHGFSERRTT
jgi:hypothetical protein